MLNFTYDLAGLKLTESYEGLRLQAYTDVRGVWTIGYGHTGAGVHEGLVIDQPTAEHLLSGDVLHAALVVNRCVTYAIDQHQFDALVDFVFNEGEGNFANSTLLRDLNAGNLQAAAEQFAEWDKAGGRVFDALVRRRSGERALFLA